MWLFVFLTMFAFGTGYNISSGMGCCHTLECTPGVGADMAVRRFLEYNGIGSKGRSVGVRGVTSDEREEMGPWLVMRNPYINRDEMCVQLRCSCLLT